MSCTTRRGKPRKHAQRKSPTAYRGKPGYFNRPVVLSTGRGDVKLTLVEARELALQLLYVVLNEESP